MAIALVPGTVLSGRYRLDRFLGQGGMGAVWAATHVVTRRAVAVKLMRGPVHARPSLRTRLLREARAASTVAHPNVIEVLDAFELDDETPVMVMPLLSGETLAARVHREEALSLTETASLLLPAISAVGTAHARGVIHRDLKPDNIFLVADAQGTSVRVLDFGIAKLSDPDPSGTPTQTGTTLGTPCYMAPEQALSEKDIDHRADIWSLGVILYECLSGVRPIEGEGVGQVVMRLMSTGITPVENLVELPSEVSALIGRMLSRERRKRPDDLREVYELLARFTSATAPTFGVPGSELRASDEVDEALPSLRATDPRDPSVPRAHADGPRRWRTAVALVAGAAAIPAFALIGTSSPPERPNPFHRGELGRAVLPIEVEPSAAPTPVAATTTAVEVPGKPPVETPAASVLRRPAAPLKSSRTAPVGLAEKPPF